MSSTYLDPHLSRVLRLAHSTAEDAYHDYCLEPYTPRRPWADKYRSENLLFHSLLVGGADAALEPPLRAVQSALGRDLTVWGVKWDGARLWWELYFYDPQKEDPNATVQSLAKVLAPWARITPAVDEAWPYMMASFDLDPKTIERGTIDAVHLYLTGEAGHAGRAYEVTEAGRELTNTYRFLEAKREVDQVLSLVKASVFVDWSRRDTLSKVIPPELWACKKICVSKKRRADAVYFSGITVEQLLWFLRRFAYPAPLVEFVHRHSARFEHLFFDVGIDYRWDAATDRLVTVKSSYYGTL
jgi:hypothetical protein